MNTVVLKFGGTSLSSYERRLLAFKKVENVIDKGSFPVVVVSAIGRKGDPYATDTLIDFIKAQYNSPKPRDMDLLLSCGEIISSVLFSTLLNANGYKSAALTGWQAGIITDSNYGEAKVLKIKTEYILQCIRNNVIPVITGFQGINENGEITTLGRGGSDTTASLIGGALNAKAIEIFTDVDGVMTADPKVEKNAKVINSLSYNEVYKIAKLGANVLTPDSIKIAEKNEIPLYVKNTLSDCQGTLISKGDVDNFI